MVRHVKPKHTKGVFLRKPKVPKATTPSRKGKYTEGQTVHQHDLPAIPSKLQPVLRKPLKTYRASQNLKKHNRRNARDLLKAIGSRLDHHAKSFGGKKIHPIAVLAWLEAEEPFQVDFLLDNAKMIADTPSDEADGDTYKVIDPVLVKQLDGLLDRFAKSTIENGPSAVENELFHVPKDYGMVQTPQTVEKDYDVFMADMEKEAKDEAKQERTWSFRDTPVTKKHKDKVSIGFDPVMVLKKNAIQFQKPDIPKASTLDNDIHPVFRIENFHGCPDAIYAVLKPGLRLASLLITHRSTAAFWHTLKFGRRTQTFRNHTWAPRISEIVPWTVINDAKWKTYVDEIAKHIHITFALWPTAKDHGIWLYGSLHPIRDYKRGFSADASPGNDGYRLGRLNLHTDFYTTAKRLSLLRSADSAQVLRFHLFLAISLCHEFAHHVEMLDPSRVQFHERFDPDLGNGGSKIENSGEAYFLDYPFQEMGYAFETFAFGGRVNPISCRSDCLYGLCTFDNVPSQNEKGVGNPRNHQEKSKLEVSMRTFWTVPMDFVARVQQKDEWEKQAKSASDEEKWLRVPRDGSATAVKVPYFDMTVWTDESEDPISDDAGKGGRETPFLRTREGRIVKRKRSPDAVVKAMAS